MKMERTNRKILVRTLLVLLVCLLAISTAVYHLMRFSAQKEESQARYVAEAATRRVEAQISRYLVVTDALKNLIEAGHELHGAQFAALAGLMMDDGGVIEVVEYAPGGIVTDAYPLEGNEEAIGLNLLENPARTKEATLAMTSGQYTIAGPFELAQGGTGALLLDPIRARDGQFWGFSLLVLNWDAFLEEVQLDRMDRSGYLYQLRRTSPSTGEKLVIAQCDAQDMDGALEVVCEVPNDTWYFEILPKAGWLTPRLRIICFTCGVLISLLISFLYWQYALRQAQEKIYKGELEKAAAEARAANEAKTRFLFNMSHDIRTPMNAILGFAHIAEENYSDPAQVRASLEKVRLAGNELLNLINEILNISRIESGAMKPAMEAADLRELCHAMQLLFESSMAEKGVRFGTSAELVQPRVICDMQHLREICINLLSNAQKFTPSGGSASLSILEREDAGAGASVYEIRISDTGIGMSEDFQKVQFELFEREESGAAAQIEGTGLGLPIVKRLVELLGGEIACESEKDRGTTYTLRFRLEHAPQSAVAEGAASPAGGATAEEFAGRRVLLAEDNALNREIALYLLEDMGLRVDCAENGAEAVELARTSADGPYDLILMDIQMPVMDGYAATRQIRSLPDPAVAGIPIVAMTANAFDEDRRNAMEAGMNAHVAKPIEVEKLREVLRAVLKR